MYRAVASRVGVYDMLRVETTQNGAFNVTEYGSVKDPDQFKALFAYSPLHHVKAGVTYPAVILTTGANDPRVDSWHSKKFAAALQASGSPNPVLLRINSAGHGMGTALDEVIAETADLYTFLFFELGVTPKLQH
jgi:prolyl oligopeptidase